MDGAAGTDGQGRGPFPTEALDNAGGGSLSYPRPSGGFITVLRAALRSGEFINQLVGFLVRHLRTDSNRPGDTIVRLALVPALLADSVVIFPNGRPIPLRLDEDLC